MKKYLVIPCLLLLVCSSCEKLQFDDPTTYTLDEAIEVTPDYYFKLASGNFTNALFRSNEGYNFGFGYMGLADQCTFTNRVNEWWDFAKEPRIRINNTQSYGGVNHIALPYDRFYKTNLNANEIINALDAGEVAIDADHNDRTAEVYAVACLIKGMSYGYLGATYDRGIISNTNEGGDQDLPNSYVELIEEAMVWFDKAIASAQAAPSITLSDFYVNVETDKAGFIKYANSMAARLLAAIPRDKAEAASLGNGFWGRVLAYAQNGLTEDFIAPYISGGFYNYSVYYGLVEAGGGAYLPADIKIPHMADNTGTYPDEYPEDASILLDEVSTDDARFATYFKYSTNFGYLRVDRGRNLFSNYKHNRWSQPGAYPNTTAVTGYPNPVFLAEETRLLRAEAKMWMGDMTGAAAELNDPAADRIALGGLAPIAATEAEVRNTIHYEYSISIQLAGSYINPWAFMRRNDLLQPGTPTEFPNPQEQLQLTPISLYTFGGADFAGEKGIWGETATAAGTSGWK